MLPGDLASQSLFDFLEFTLIKLLVLDTDFVHDANQY